MAFALSRSLLGSGNIKWITGASHYSALKAFFDKFGDT
jgi:hypothetical protein